MPVIYISYQDALDYCEWLTEKDEINTYWLPSQTEWELVAGHMSKDADFNAGNINSGRVSVFEYDNITRGAHGAIDFWGNLWEWTTTTNDNTNLKVKGGSWKSDRTDCRTENRKENRNKLLDYDDVGFRTIQILNSNELEKKFELGNLETPNLTAEIYGTNSVMLDWSRNDKAVNYQVYNMMRVIKYLKCLIY